MKVRNICTILTAICFVAVTGSVSGQNLNPRQFYDNDFARSPIEDYWKSNTGRASIRFPKNSKRDVSPPEARNKILQEKINDSGKDTVDKDIILSGEKVESLGLIVNGVDKSHFSKSIDELINLSVDYKVPIGIVYSVGPGTIKRDGIPAEYIGIAARGGVLQAVGKPPAKYPVALSPSWLLLTKRGWIIIEAPGNIRRFLNVRGELVNLPTTIR